MDESVIEQLEESASVRRLLLRAAEILEEGGHCKGMAQKDTAHCLSGAVSAATMEKGYSTWDFYHGHDACFARIERALGGENAVAWNDAPERSKEEVVSFLRRVAESA